MIATSRGEAHPVAVSLYLLQFFSIFNHFGTLSISTCFAAQGKTMKSDELWIAKTQMNLSNNKQDITNNNKYPYRI